MQRFATINRRGKCHFIYFFNKQGYSKDLIDTLLIYTLCYGFLNDFDAQSDFGKKNCHKKACPLQPFLSYMLKGKMANEILQITKSHLK